MVLQGKWFNDPNQFTTRNKQDIKQEWPIIF